MIMTLMVAACQLSSALLLLLLLRWHKRGAKRGGCQQQQLTMMTPKLEIARNATADDESGRKSATGSGQSECLSPVSVE